MRVGPDHAAGHTSRHATHAADASDNAAGASWDSAGASGHAADDPACAAHAAGPAPPLSRGASRATSAGLRQTVALQWAGEAPVTGGSHQQGEDGLGPGRVAGGGQGLG